VAWLKSLVDKAARAAQRADEAFSDDAVLLDVERSVQLDGWSCGAQSGYMLLRYFGKARSLDATARALRTDEDGTSEASLLRLFRQRQLRVRVRKRATLRDLRGGIDRDAPSLVSMDDGGHWAIVYGYSASKIFVADPSLLRSVGVGFAVSAFENRWDHWAAIVSRK